VLAQYRTAVKEENAYSHQKQRKWKYCPHPGGGISGNIPRRSEKADPNLADQAGKTQGIDADAAVIESKGYL